MPLLSNVLSEKVSLATDEKSVHKPPHKATPEPTYNAARGTDVRGTKGPHVDGGGKASCVASASPTQHNGVNSDSQPLANGRKSGSIEGNREKSSGHSLGKSSSSLANGSMRSNQELNDEYEQPNGILKSGNAHIASSTNQAKPTESVGRRSMEGMQGGKSWHKGHHRAHSSSAPPNAASSVLGPIQGSPTPLEDGPRAAAEPNAGTSRLPPSLPVSQNAADPAESTLSSSLHPSAPRLHHRHTLEVPRVSTSRTSRDFSYPNNASDGASDGGRFTPGPRTPRASNTLARAPTRSIHSDMFLDEVPPDSDMARWTETIRQKRASRRKKKEEEEDDRVVVGTKVDVNHVNWVTAYNMLTGLRFTVSRTNAKMDRDLTDADFDARHKFSFDITGNELTPSAKYDFKFKDYAPWVFRHLRAKFKLDPADYLMSLTSKYILSELGSPGKSGSFFYFSRDYKYIIKTIHHAEHKLLRKILREYYAHIEKYPNTLISQFYGLHRVKIPYGRKIHFVVMNNLFPPHRDIHQTFDLKGSTIGRDFKEEDLEKNPRATLKDLNWLRRNYHFEFGSHKKALFVEQMKRDVALLQKLKIMDYSLLVGIHDLNKGNEENLRDKTLRVFQPGGDEETEPQIKMLTRTPSKLENTLQAKQLREIIKKEKPVPMDKSTSKMPEEMLEERKNFIFYSDDGGFGATHEDGQPGEEIYYLGIIDCLTHVSQPPHYSSKALGLTNLSMV